MSRHKNPQPQGRTMDALHAKCPNTPCTGPQCRRTRPYGYSTAEPRVKTRLTKPERRLEARIKSFEAGPNTASGQEMHKPGSKKK